MPYKRVLEAPCFDISSLRKHPQLLDVPSLSFLPFTIRTVPQSQRHFHQAPVWVLPAYSITVHLPRCCPVKSIRLLIVHLSVLSDILPAPHLAHGFVKIFISIPTQIATYLPSATPHHVAQLALLRNGFEGAIFFQQVMS